MDGGGETSSSVRSPRLCSMARGPQGYGFNLHGEKGIVGQYISAVDKGGPADLAGLCVGDRVVEVNHFNVEEASHATVVSKIKENSELAILLVVDKVTDEYLHKIGVPITEDLVKHDSVLILSQNNAGHDVDEGQEEDSVQPDEDNSDRMAVETTDYGSVEQRSSPTAEENIHVVESGLTEVHVTEETTETSYIGQQQEQQQQQQQQHHVYNHAVATTNGEEEEEDGRRLSLPGERISQSSEDSLGHQSASTAGESGRMSADSGKMSMAAARPKPRRRQIKEDKSESWASKAALFNNL